MKKLTNHDITVGAYRATECEWYHNDTMCGATPVFGKPYCPTHMSQAYTRITEQEFEQQADEMLKTVIVAEKLGRIANEI